MRPLIPRLCFVAGLALLAAPAAALDAVSLPHPAIVGSAEPAGTPWPNDLRSDPDFGDHNGTARLAAPDRAGFLPQHRAVRVFPWYTPLHGLSGYYLFVRQKYEALGWGAWITRVHINGDVDTAFGSEGWMSIPGVPRSVDDAALAGDRLYVLRSVAEGSTNRAQIQCWSLATNSDCFPGGPVSLRFNVGTAINAFGRRILHDSRYGLLVTANLRNTTAGNSIGITRLDATTGAAISTFGTQGFINTAPTWSSQPRPLASVHDMALAAAGTPGGDDRLYVVGSARTQAAAADDDGFVHGIDPETGNGIAGWNWQRVSYEADNPAGAEDDAVTTLTVQRNGRVAVAGWSTHGSTGFQDLILARFLANGLPDPVFCGGEVCNKSLDYSYMTHPKDNVPVGIAERVLNGDLVVLHTDRYPSEPESQWQMQRLTQFGASGTREQGRSEFLHAQPLDRVSAPTALWIGQLGALGYGPEVVVAAGYQSYNSAVIRPTIAQRISSDYPNTIFVTGFGHANND
ncbi:MAG: delta-60 repeat domain-containing protein [Xanthomonadales bacterium]|nr:delta-60 repeat domain-containing protein [Xanthomonadales bacterium]